MYVCMYVYLWKETYLLVRTAMVDIISRMAYQVPISSADRGSGLDMNVCMYVCMYVCMFLSK